MSPQQQDRRANLVLLAITALWGTTFAIIQQGLAHANTFSFLAVRFAIGAVALAALARFRVFAWRSNLAGFGLGALSFVGFALQTGGLNYTTAPRSAFITGLTVVMVPTVVGLWGRRPTRSTWVALVLFTLGVGGATWGGAALPGWAWAALIATALVGIGSLRAMKPAIRAAVCLALAGLAMMTRPAGGLEPSTLRGDLLTLGCTFAFGLSILLSEKVSPRHPVFPLVFGHLVGIGTLSALCASVAGWRFEPCRELWGSVVFCGVVASAICLAGQTYAMQRASATRAALIYALEPVFAATFAWMWKGEGLARAEAIGGALIIAATLVEPLKGVWKRVPGAQPRASLE